jgi:hypothetical protein
VREGKNFLFETTQHLRGCPQKSASEILQGDEFTLLSRRFAVDTVIAVNTNFVMTDLTSIVVGSSPDTRKHAIVLAAV